jgi:hypothetical protein
MLSAFIAYRMQPRTQALSTTRLAGGKTLVQAGHVFPRFWEITIGTYGGYREGKCGVRVQNNTRSVNKATQRATQSRTQSNACARARMALALGLLAGV